FHRRHTGRNFSVDQRIEVMLHFLRHFRIAPFFSKRTEKTRGGCADCFHESSPGKDEVDASGNARPMLLLCRELLSSGGSQFIIASLSIAIGDTPFCSDPALGLETIKGRVEGTLLHAQNFLRHLLNAVRNGEPVPRIMLERLQDQHVEGAVNEIWFFSGHGRVCLDSLDETTI